MYRKSIIMGIVILCLAIGIPHGYVANSIQSVDTIDNERFAFSNALTGVANIKAWLKSFRVLTTLTADRITAEEKQQVGNISADMQTLGFYNWPRAVEGTLRKQNYDICKLEYELALERRAAGKVNQAEVDAKNEKYQAAQKDLQGFLDKFHVAD